MPPYECIIVDSEINQASKGKKRISLAYAELEEMPSEILIRLADQIQFLDLSYNGFKNLSFLRHFPALKTLVLDRNFNLECETLPPMHNLHILWLNNCNLINITGWLHQLQVQCPNLKHLSMMCNPVGQTVLNGVTAADEHTYRKQVVHMLPQLSHFDGVAICKSLRQSREQGLNVTLPLALLENVVRRKAHTIRHYSTRLKKNFASMESLHSVLLSFGSKQVAANT